MFWFPVQSVSFALSSTCLGLPDARPRLHDLGPAFDCSVVWTLCRHEISHRTFTTGDHRGQLYVAMHFTRHRDASRSRVKGETVVPANHCARSGIRNVKHGLMSFAKQKQCFVGDVPRKAKEHAWLDRLSWHVTPGDSAVRR